MSTAIWSEVKSWEANEGGHDGVITEVSNNMFGTGEAGYHSEGKGGRKSYYCWPKEGSDFEIDGLTLRLYNPSHAYVGGRRAITHEFTYSPPEN